ncbi:MAG: glycosyltransferase family A protein [Myxococcota bacterium]
MNAGPGVSVLMPAYNHAKWVREAIESVFAQTYRPIELIVIDDGSRDDTFAAIQTAVRDAPIPVHTTSRANRGVSATLNECYRLSSGKLIAHLASDDMYRPTFVERVVERYQAVGNAVFHTDAVRLVGSRFEPLGRSRIPAEGHCFRELAEGKLRIISSTVVVPRTVWETCGDYDESFRAEDYDMHLRQARVAPFEYIDEALFVSRALPGSLGRSPAIWADDIFASLRKHADFFATGELDVILQNRRMLLAHTCAAHGQWRSGLHFAAEAVRNARVDSMPGVALKAARTVALSYGRGAVARRLPASTKRWLKAKLRS